MKRDRTAEVLKKLKHDLERLHKIKKYTHLAGILSYIVLLFIFSLIMPLFAPLVLFLALPLFIPFLVTPYAKHRIAMLEREEEALKVGINAKNLPRIAKWNIPDYSGSPDGFVLGHDARTGNIVRVQDTDILQGGALTVGTTGSGKTSFFLALAYQQLLRGKGAIYIDAKGSKTALQKVIYLCKKTGRLSDLLILNPSDPANSHTYNPLLSGDIDLLTSKVMSILPPPPPATPAAHFYRLAETAVRRIITALKETGLGFSYEHIRLCLETPDKTLPVLQRMLVDSKSREGLVAVQSILNQYKISAKNQDIDTTKTSYDFGGIIAELSALSTGEMESFLCTGTSDIDLLDVLQKGKILFINLPALGRGATSEKLGKALLADLLACCGYLYEHADKYRINGPFPVLADEFANYASTEYAKIFQMGRELQVITFASVQTFANLQNRARGLSEDFKTMVIGNTHLKVFFAAGDSTTAEEMAKNFGQELASFEHFTIGENRANSGQALSIWDRFVNPRSSVGQTKQTGAREAYDFVVRPEVLQHELRLEKGLAIVDNPPNGPMLIRCAYPIMDEADYESIDVASEMPRFVPKVSAMLNFKKLVEDDFHKDALLNIAKTKSDKPAHIQQEQRAQKVDSPSGQTALSPSPNQAQGAQDSLPEVDESAPQSQLDPTNPSNPFDIEY